MAEYQRVTIEYKLIQSKVKNWYEGSELQKRDNHRNRYEDEDKKLVHALGQMVGELTEEYMDKYSDEFIYEHSDPHTLRRKFSARAVVVYADNLDVDKLSKENQIKRVITVDENGEEETFRC